MSGESSLVRTLGGLRQPDGSYLPLKQTRRLHAEHKRQHAEQEARHTRHTALDHAVRVETYAARSTPSTAKILRAARAFERYLRGRARG